MDNYVGKRLDGRYEIQEIIGVGGMAVVYKAYDNIDDRIVAVKILKEEYLANEEFRRRFKNESKAIAVLSHPNIVKVYDVSFGDKLQYIVMEYIDGITLKEYIEQQKVINWKEAVHFTTQILRALQHAHDKGIVHRDVKPQNIMLLQNGNIKVADFGIARFSRGETRTMTESAIGSVHYISPEQARGEITDDKADIYSVGVVIYEMLTGQLPFQSDSAVSVAIMQLQTDPRLPREINDSIPLGLEQITIRAMQKNAKDRYQSAAEMLLDLDEFKRNPAIKFDYTYFVDNEPTKFVEGAAQQVAMQAAESDAYDSEPERSLRTKVVPIIAGISIALVAVVGIILIILSATGTFSKNKKIQVPNFIGKQYEDVIANPDYKDFTFERKQQYDTKNNPGIITAQDPVANASIDSKSNKITLTVATAAETKEVPLSLIGKSADEAKKALKALGFTNITVDDTQFDADKKTSAGQVFKTDPVMGNTAGLTDTITLFVNSGKDNTEVDVPRLTGTKFDAAQGIVSKLNSSQNASIKLVSTSQNSNLPKDTIISQTPAYVEGTTTKMAKDGTIDVVVSNGIPESGTVAVSYTFPKVPALDGQLKVYQNSQVKKDNTKYKLDGSVFTYTFSGSGTTDTFELVIDGQTVYKGTLNFQTGKAENETKPAYKVTVPNVTGLDEAAAEEKLAQYGLVMTTDADFSETVAKGKVISQTPADGKLEVGKTVRVKISKGKAAATPNPAD